MRLIGYQNRVRMRQVHFRKKIKSDLTVDDVHEYMNDFVSVFMVQKIAGPERVTEKQLPFVIVCAKDIHLKI